MKKFICGGCGACVIICPKNAISLVEEKTADIFLTKTEKGIIFREMMGIGSDGSGKLVTQLGTCTRRSLQQLINNMFFRRGKPWT